MGIKEDILKRSLLLLGSQKISQYCNIGFKCMMVKTTRQGGGGGGYNFVTVSMKGCIYIMDLYGTL